MCTASASAARSIPVQSTFEELLNFFFRLRKMLFAVKCRREDEAKGPRKADKRFAINELLCRSRSLLPL